MSSLDYLDLCRLCLVKDRVSVPIFEDEGDVRQIFLKITACLPVKVSREDKLPKKICDDCVYKVELFYQFWNTTANAEKQLLQWLGEVGGLEENQSYVTEVLDSNVMKQERSSDSRLDASVMQVGGHQNNMDMGMIDNMSLITMPTGNEQFTSVPMDTTSAVQTVQAVPGSSTQTTHDQMSQNRTAVTHLVEEEEESEDEENSDDGCDNEEGLPVKEETEEDPSDQPLEPTTFVNVSIPCDEAGPSGLQQQKISEISEMTIPQTADGDSKTGLLAYDQIEHPVKFESLQNINEDNLYSAIMPTTIKSEIVNVPNFNDDFEEVSIDGRSSSSPSVSTTTAVNNKTLGVFKCKPCKIYFPLQDMYSKHMKTIHHRDTSVEIKKKRKTKSILERLKEKAGGYRRKKNELYVCNYCSYTSSIQTAVSSHVARKHGNFRKSVAVCTPSVTVAIEPASIEVKEELVEEVELIDEEPKEQALLVKETAEIFYPDSEIMPEEIELIGEEMEIIGEGIEIVGEDTEFIDEETQIVPIVSTDAELVEEGEKYNYEMFSDEYETTNTLYTKVYNCPYCEFQSNRRSTMHSHITNKHDKEWKEAINQREDAMRSATQTKYVPLERNHVCYYCHFAATTRSTLNAHTRRKHPGYLQPTKSRKQPPTEMHCDQCDFTTTDRHKIQMHIERKHVTECRYTCEYCGKKFKVKCDLTSHIRFQHFRTPTVCDVCGKICSNSNALRVHQKREHYKPDFECRICKRRMVSQENLDEHIQRQHEQRIKFICEQCGKVFDQQNKLKQHTMTHTGERPHNCHLCGKSFARRAVFRQHLLIHTGQRPYVCDICGKSFTQKPGLICHRKMHPGDKPPLPVVYIDHILDKFVHKVD